MSLTEQEYTLEKMVQEENDYQFSHFDATVARKLGLRYIEEAERRDLSIVVDIVLNNRPVFYCAMPGTKADHDQWIIRKRRVVERFSHSSLYIGTLIKAQQSTLQDMFFLNPMEFAPFGGGFPIHLKSCGMVGIVTISGLTEVEDHRLCVWGLQ